MPRTHPVIERTWTVMDLIRWGTSYFNEHGVDSPRLTMELLLCHVLKVSRITLYTNFEQPLTKDELAELRALVKRRSQHEPLQYILGTSEFYGLAFEVGPSVLIPRPETELLAERVIRFLKSHPVASCLDIGTGSGCIPISCAVHAPGSTWICVDRERDAAEVAARNAQRHCVSDRVTVLTADILTTPERIRAHAPFDVVTMNPPYIPVAEVATLQEEVRDYEPHAALTDDADGLTFYRWFADSAAMLLAEQGRGFLEIGHGQDTEIQALMQSAGLRSIVHEDLARIPRVMEVSHGILGDAIG
jgi:release factor glutamine methyltransferase